MAGVSLTIVFSSASFHFFHSENIKVVVKGKIEVTISSLNHTKIIEQFFEALIESFLLCSRSHKQKIRSIYRVSHM